MKFIFPSLPEALLGSNYHVEVMESVWIVELYLDPGWFVFLQLLDLQITPLTPGCSYPGVILAHLLDKQFVSNGDPTVRLLFLCLGRLPVRFLPESLG